MKIGSMKSPARFQFVITGWRTIDLSPASELSLETNAARRQSARP